VPRRTRCTARAAKIKRAENDDGKRSVNDYVMLHQLGSGAYGKVRLCVDQRNAERVALKIMSKALLRKRCVRVRRCVS
jgi:serine/threonine protein kinase